ncbi:hypothetical protein GCM10008933_09880 [Paenibacillus motobuensis]|uniref:Uncharacterized protein n=1 Tax=Paenibacillus motobuensis TaxID=295324 RepID=A0ABN0Y2A7_9BACL
MSMKSGFIHGAVQPLVYVMIVQITCEFITVPVIRRNIAPEYEIVNQFNPSVIEDLFK